MYVGSFFLVPAVAARQVVLAFYREIRCKGWADKDDIYLHLAYQLSSNSSSCTCRLCEIKKQVMLMHPLCHGNFSCARIKHYPTV